MRVSVSTYSRNNKLYERRTYEVADETEVIDLAERIPNFLLGVLHEVEEEDEDDS